ncbi:hypothetical protein OROMI_025018 [Orobanche minor]
MMSNKEAIVDLGGSRRRGSAPKAGSVWENRMKLDEIKGGIKVFYPTHENSQEDTQDNSVSNLNHSPDSQMDKKVIEDVVRHKQSPTGMSGKRKTWKPENSEGSPLQIAKQRSELRKNLDQEFKELAVSAKSPVWIKKRRSIPFPPSDGHDKDAIQLRRVKSDSTEVMMDHGSEKTEVKSEPIKKPDEKIKNSDDLKVVVEPKRDLEGYNGKIGKSPDGVEHSRSHQDCKDVSDNFHGIPRSRTNSRLQSFVDLVMWEDVTKSAFIFGIGTFGIISSSYTNDLNIRALLILDARRVGTIIRFISVVSYLGLVYLGAIFLFRSLIISRGSMGMDMDMDSSTKQDCVVGEEEAIWVVKLILPYLNEFLLTLRALFSGDPATTMKLAVLLFILARCGSSITIWKMAKLGTFWSRRFGDAWESCSHKKAVAFAVFSLVWNFSSAVARIWAVFMLFAAFKYYKQSLIREGWEGEERATGIQTEETVLRRGIVKPL